MLNILSKKYKGGQNMKYSFVNKISIKFNYEDILWTFTRAICLESMHSNLLNHFP